MIPISTDAPLYHYPIATVSVMVLNVLVFLAVGLNPGYEAVELDDPHERVSQPAPPPDDDGRRGWDEVIKEEEDNGDEINEPGFDPLSRNGDASQQGKSHCDCKLVFYTETCVWNSAPLSLGNGLPTTLCMTVGYISLAI